MTNQVKGWESSVMILCISDASDLKLAYTGMTRLKATAAGALMTVVCCLQELESFGRRWPNFQSLAPVRPAGERSVSEGLVG
jgi:hypothetical protein